MKNAIDSEKAYLLGLFVGGGHISQESFQIILPYDKWGADPRRMTTLARDILGFIQDCFNKKYSIKVRYEIQNKRWAIIPFEQVGLAQLKADLNYLGLPSVGVLLDTADLVRAKGILGKLQTEKFLAGIFDARASLTETHRRFTNSAPVVSIEIPGSTENFKFVVQLCSWLTELGSITDQILYNHPCMHSGLDPYYANWRKGFKIRFLVRSFLARHSFALKAKSFDADRLEGRQVTEEQVPCLERKLRKPKVVSIHRDINDPALPPEVRRKLFFHYHHICAVMGCPFAPISNIKTLVGNYRDYISVFPIWRKGDLPIVKSEFMQLIQKVFPDAKLIKEKYHVKDCLRVFSPKDYPKIEEVLAYLFSKKLKGRRHIGPKNRILSLAKNNHILIIRLTSIQNGPLLLINNVYNRAGFVSSPKSTFNKEVIKKIIKITGLNVEVK